MSYLKEFDQLCRQHIDAGDLPYNASAQFILKHLSAILNDCANQPRCPFYEMTKIVDHYFGDEAFRTITLASPCITNATCGETAKKPHTVELQLRDRINRIGREIGYYARLEEPNE